MLDVIGHINNLSWPDEMINNLNIQNEVKLHGFISDPSTILKRSDAMVLSTNWEGTPNVILEAMANQIPVICSDVPGCKVIMDEAKCGYTFLKGSCEDLAYKLSILIGISEKERKKLIQFGYEYVLKEHGNENIFNLWEAKINQILCVE